MNKSAVIAAAADVALKVARVAPLGAEGILAAQAVLTLLDELRGTSGAAPERIAEFDRSRDELERAVNAHADRTIASLG